MSNTHICMHTPTRMPHALKLSTRSLSSATIILLSDRIVERLNVSYGSVHIAQNISAFESLGLRILCCTTS